MVSCFFMAWFGIATTVLSGFSGTCWYYGIENVSAEGEDTREGRISKYCASVDGWKSRSAYLSGFRYHLRNSQGDRVDCTLASTPTENEDGAPTMSDGECRNYAINKIVCGGLDHLIPQPTLGTAYELKLFSVPAEEGSMQEGSSVGDVRITVALEKNEAVPLESNSNNNCKGQCREKEARTKCEEAQGRYDDWNCHILFRLEAPGSVNEACFVLSPSQSAASGFLLSSNMWPEEAAADAQAGYRCIKPVRAWNAEPDMRRHFPDAGLSSPASLQGHVSNAVVTFRHSDDPFVIASSLSGSEFDFGWTKAAKMAAGIALLIGATCLSCCTLGCFAGFCIAGVCGGGTKVGFLS